MTTGDSNDMLTRIKRVVPSRWFAYVAPLRDAVLGGIADQLAWIYSLIAFAELQTRISTATGFFLDLIAFDYFGLFIRRRVAEIDTAFSARIKKEILRERVTRNGMIQALTDLTGKAPVVFEPSSTFDACGYGAGAMVSRASVAWFFDQTGTLQQAPVNFARYNYSPANMSAAPTLLVEPTRTNAIRNNAMVGAGAGAVPTYWSAPSAPAGMTASIVGAGVESGIPYVDVAFTGTCTTAGYAQVQFEQAGAIPAAQGQMWSQSMFLRLVSGSFPAGAAAQAMYTEWNSSNAYLTQQFPSFSSNPTAAALNTQRDTNTFTIPTAATASITPSLIIQTISIGATAFTIRIGAPQLELAASASSPILTYGAAFTRAAETLTSGPVGFACGYGVAGGYGNIVLNNQVFLTVYRPGLQGVPNVDGYGGGLGGYGVGAVEYIGASMVQGQVTDADIYTTIEATKPSGAICWTKLI